MKPVVLGLLGAVALAAALAAVSVLVDPREAASPGAATQAGAPKATARPDRTAAMLADAERVLNRGDTPAAKSIYLRARAQYQRDGDAAGEAAAAFGLGKLEHFNGQSEAARTAFDEALALFEQVDDPAGLARVEVAYGDLEKDTFRGPQAMQRYRAARLHWGRVPEPKSDPHVLLNLDRAAQMPEGEARARAVIDQADKIFHNIGDVEGEGDAGMMLGALEMSLFNLGASQAAFQVARDRYAEAGLGAKQFDAVLAVASALIQQGYNIDAGAQLRAAAALVGTGTNLATRIAAARLAAATGDLERLPGRLAQARDQFEHAAMALPAANSADEPATFLKLGRVQLALNQVGEARQSLEAAIARGDQLGRADLAAAARLELGILALRTNDLTAARTMLGATAIQLRGQRDPVAEGRAHLAIGDAALRQNDAAAARAAYATAAEVLNKVPYGLMLAQLGRGDAARAAGDAAGARAAYAAAAELRAAISTPIAEAGRLLALPAVESLYYVAAGEVPHDEDPPDPAIVQAAQAMRAANFARYPTPHAEARALVAATEPRLAAAAAFAQGN